MKIENKEVWKGTPDQIITKLKELTTRSFYDISKNDSSELSSETKIRESLEQNIGKVKIMFFLNPGEAILNNNNTGIPEINIEMDSRIVMIREESEELIIRDQEIWSGTHDEIIKHIEDLTGDNELWGKIDKSDLTLNGKVSEVLKDNVGNLVYLNYLQLDTLPVGSDNIPAELDNDVPTIKFSVKGNIVKVEKE